MIGAVLEHKRELGDLCRRFRVKKLDLFGSAVTEGSFDNGKSDIDFAVEFEAMEPVAHARAYFGLLAALQDLFSCPIDLIEIKAVTNPYMLESVNKQRREIYAA